MEGEKAVELALGAGALESGGAFSLEKDRGERLAGGIRGRRRSYFFLR
jgi:hypothetical protein